MAIKNGIIIDGMLHDCALEYVMSAHYKMSAMIVQKSFAI